MEKYVARNPQKNYGILNWGGGISPTLLATDYKSPPIVLEIEYEQQEIGATSPE
jgi:hypothetical protein